MGSTRSSFDRALLGEVRRRLCAHAVTKALGMSVGMSLFFAAYFQLLKHPIFPVTVMPVTGIDRFIAFRAEALPLYLSLWLYVVVPVGLLKNRAELWSYARAAGVLSVLGLTIFLVWPTTIPDLGPAWAPGSVFSFLKTIDAAGNACPSLHVAFAVFTAILLERLLREIRASRFLRVGNWLWCLGIAYSTLAVAQHVALDVAAGALLGALVAGPRRLWSADFGASFRTDADPR